MIISSPSAIGFEAAVTQWADEQATISTVGMGLSASQISSEATGWTLLSFAPFESPDSIEITGVAPAVFGQAGGYELTLTLGGSVIPGDIQVYVDDVLCYGGQGYGYTPITDGLTVTVWTPLLATKGVVKTRVVQGSLSAEFDVTVLERTWAGKQFGIRQSFPRWCGVGARRLDLEDPI